MSYPGFFPLDEVRIAAERLAARQLLQRRFFERFHVCAGCNSSRLNVREECPSCRSAQLRDVALLHHFRCAHQAPEASFVQGAHLVCPKCRQTLRHYGSDYDKPGMATACSECATISAEPVVGFSCLDCGIHTDGAAAAKRDVFAYVLSSEGIALLQRGVARIAAIAAGPDTLPVAITDALHSDPDAAALIELSYAAQSSIIARRGRAAFLAMRRLFVENLVSALDGACVLRAGVQTDHLLIRSSAAHTLPGLNAALLQACQEVLAEGLEPELRWIELPGVGSPHA